jgi:hypothetical protein
MAAPRIIGTSTCFGLVAAQGTMEVTSTQASGTSNKAEAKNINGGTSTVVYFGKKAEYNVEGFMTSTNSVTIGGSLAPTNLAGFNGLGAYYLEEVTLTKSSEDFTKLKYKIVARDGIA